MLIIDHRRNEIAQLQATSGEFGIEVDLRNHGNDILVTHDPFITAAPRLEDWLDAFHHRFLIANVKEEGMETKLLPLLERKGIKNFFILDESFPFIRKYALAGIEQFALRVSEFEDYRTAINLAHDLAIADRKVGWIWADSFTGAPLPPETAVALRTAGFKICAVSPELHHVNDPASWDSRVTAFLDKLQEPSFAPSRPDMVCTKLPEKWAAWQAGL
ncbi:hypothetical protein HW509_11945 [Asaia spathodeae]|uniref:hypothetical protein n=1 Tax=Asaia spathodeae TaxID=657016 RepID=UPI002FC347CF